MLPLPRPTPVPKSASAPRPMHIRMSTCAIKIWKHGFVVLTHGTYAPVVVGVVAIARVLVHVTGRRYAAMRWVLARVAVRIHDTSEW
jgi:hypothetical protein